MLKFPNFIKAVKEVWDRQNDKHLIELQIMRPKLVGNFIKRYLKEIIQ